MVESGFKKLEIWQRGKDLAVEIYKVTAKGDIGKDFGLRDQIRRSAVSIPSNIAEGDERETDKESIRFFYIAKGSLAELRTQIQIAYEIGYVDEKLFNNLDDRYARLASMIGAMIKARKRKR